MVSSRRENQLLVITNARDMMNVHRIVYVVRVSMVIDEK